MRLFLCALLETFGGLFLFGYWRGCGTVRTLHLARLLARYTVHCVIIVFCVDLPSMQGVPNLVQEDGCQAVFEWPSEAACGTRTIESKLPIVGPPSGGSKHSNQYSDASPVTEPPPPVLPDCVVESNVNHGVFDMRPLMGTVYKLKDANGMSYNLSVCGVLPKGSCPDAKTPHASVCQQTTRNGGNEWVRLYVI